MRQTYPKMMCDELLNIRRSTSSDIPRMAEIYRTARDFMSQTGNPTQWNDGYPSVELLQNDINRGISYIVEYEGRAVGTFAFAVGEDSTYCNIKGKWIDDTPYGTIHRIASDGSIRGIADACLRFCTETIGNIRIDTHADNRVMLNWITRAGFRYCGIIHVADGSPRYAFQLKT